MEQTEQFQVRPGNGVRPPGKVHLEREEEGTRTLTVVEKVSGTSGPKSKGGVNPKDLGCEERKEPEREDVTGGVPQPSLTQTGRTLEDKRCLSRLVPVSHQSRTLSRTQDPTVRPGSQSTGPGF